MQTTRFYDVSEFAALAVPILGAHEAENNLALGIISTIRSGKPRGERPFLAVVYRFFKPNVQQGLPGDRLHRSIGSGYLEVYARWHRFESLAHAQWEVFRQISEYNAERPHQSIGYVSPRKFCKQETLSVA